MKLKNKTKFLLVLGIILIAILILNFNEVKALSEDDEKILANIPDTITINTSNETLEDKIAEIPVPEKCKIKIKKEDGISDKITTSIDIMVYDEETGGILLTDKRISIKYVFLETMINLIPETITLNVPESEFKKAEEIVEKNIIEIWKNNGIEAKEIERLSISASPLNLGKEGFYNAFINVYYDSSHKGQNRYFYTKKTIKLIYNNTNDYNLEDEIFVKNLKIESPEYYEVNLDSLSKDMLLNADIVENEIGKYYTNLINDSSIIIRYNSYSGNGVMLNVLPSKNTQYVSIFKNGVLYDIKQFHGIISVPVINVPNTVKEEDINNYAIDLLKSYFNDFEEFSLAKGTEKFDEIDIDIDIPDSYTLLGTSKKGQAQEVGLAVVIIRKQSDTSVVEITDEETNIKLDAPADVVPKDTTLVAKEIKANKTLNVVKETLKNVSKKFTVYDINLISKNVAIQPNGKVKVIIPIPDGFNKEKLVVYRIESNGNKIEYPVILKDNKATFETDHFSVYVLAENNVVINNDKTENNEQDNTTTTQEPTNKGEKDETPKTGTIDIIGYVLLVSVFSGIGILSLKKKSK